MWRGKSKNYSDFWVIFRNMHAKRAAATLSIQKYFLWMSWNLIRHLVALYTVYENLRISWPWTIILILGLHTCNMMQNCSMHTLRWQSHVKCVLCFIYESFLFALLCSISVHRSMYCAVFSSNYSRLKVFKFDYTRTICWYESSNFSYSF